MSKIKIFAIVVTYNGKKWLDKCFGSLFQSSVPLKIIAIDNASSDGTPSIIKRKFPEVELIKSEKNLGFGQANNIGLRKALDKEADYVFLLNQDAWVEKDTIGKLIYIQKRNPDFGVLSPVHLKNQSEIDNGFLRHLLKYKPLGFLYGSLTLDLQREVYPISFINAAAWLIPNSTIHSVGGFMPLFFHYGEDENYCARVIYKGFKVGFVPGAMITHDREYFIRGQTLRSMYNRVFNHFLLVLAHPGSSADKYRLFSLFRAVLLYLRKNVYRPLRVSLLPFVLIKLLVKHKTINDQKRTSEFDTYSFL
jgi:GT2 family glycosyltransferase